MPVNRSSANAPANPAAPSSASLQNQDGADSNPDAGASAPEPTRDDFVGTGGYVPSDPNSLIWQPPQADGLAPRDIGDLFDYGQPVTRRAPQPRNGFFGGVLRGDTYSPVFGEGGNWFTRGLGDAGNLVMDSIGRGVSSLLHRQFEASTTIPISEQFALGLQASGRKMREDELAIDDARRIAIAELRAQHPGALPIWIETDLNQTLGFDVGHQIPLGVTGANVRFGFRGDQGLGFTAHRLVFTPPANRDGIVDSARQLARLRLTPLVASHVAQMETGARFEIRGSANLRVDAGLGFGASVPSLHEALRIGVDVEAGAYAGLSGQFNMAIQRLDGGRARLTISSLGNTTLGAHFRAQAGVTINHHEVSRLLRGFVDFIAGGGDPHAFANQLPNEHERQLASDLSGYMRVLAKNLADGAGSAVLNGLIERFGTLYLEARGGINLTSSVSTTVDFDFESDQLVELPRADMVPESMRHGAAADEPVQVRVGELSQLAYDMAVRGDLRLIQQLVHIRNSGVRVNESTASTSNTREASFRLGLPFAEMSRMRSTTNAVVERYTPELGRIRTALSSFNDRYQGLFGRTRQAAGEVRVHTPSGNEDAEVFFASDDNFSADFSKKNIIEPRTNYDEMRTLMGILNTLSNGRMEEQAREALASGAYRDDGFWQNINPIHQIFFKPREFGRTIAHLHIWLGEPGLRHLLESDLSRDELYRRIGEVFARIDGEDGTQLPAWAAPGADRSLRRGRSRRQALRGGSAELYGVGPMDHNLATARYLVDNITALRASMRDARTPQQEEAVAGRIRDFLRDAKNRLPAYAALAHLVPEEHRAVEMRVSAIRRDQVPIRFTYIQDSRTSDILYATGFAQMAMQQYQRYAILLDSETRLRLGSLLGRMHEVLNSPSPDPFRLRTTMRALEDELVRMDGRAEEMASRIEEDINLARVYLAGLPSVETIQTVLPGSVGSELASMRMTALRQVNAANPSVESLRATFRALGERAAQYRRIEAVAGMVQSVGEMGNALAEYNSEMVARSVHRIDTLRTLLANPQTTQDAFEEAARSLSEVHTEMLTAIGHEANTGTLAEVHITPSEAANEDAESQSVEPEDLQEQRNAGGERLRALAGHPDVAPISYFERRNIVPTSYMGAPYESQGAGIVTAAMISEAQLAMATTRPTGELDIPSLSQANVDRLVGLAREQNAAGFLQAADELRYVSEDWFEDPRRHVIEYLLFDIPESERQNFVRHLSASRRSIVERIFSEQDRIVMDMDDARRSRMHTLRNNPHINEDLQFLQQLYREDPSKLEGALNDLGYGRVLDQWHARSTARLEGALSQITGDDLNKLVRKMNRRQQSQFLELLRTSDLRPQTRARLAGQIVDNNFFWRRQEELVAALVTGMNAGDLRIFFDQLHTDGKLEDFLSAGSFWQTLLVILTFGIAALFTHNNEAALRVVAAHGWSIDELRAEYTGRQLFTPLEFERTANRVLFDSVLNTTPMDPYLRGGLRTLHGMLGNVKYYHFAEFPDEARRALNSMAVGAGRQLVRRIGDVAQQGGSPREIVEEYRRFFGGLTPNSVAAAMEASDMHGPPSIVFKALADGALAGLIQAAADPRNRFITYDLVNNIAEATNQFDSPIEFSGTRDPRLSQATYDGMIDRFEFFREYTQFNYSRVKLLYGGLAVAAPAVAFGPYISVATNRAEQVNGELVMGEHTQNTLVFHEAVHTLQQIIYGSSVNAFLDQAIAIVGHGDRNEAYRVTAAMFDQADSIDAFRQNWEQQAELLEQSFRLMYERYRATGSVVAAEAWPGPGVSLNVAGGRIDLTPERWQKMIRFMREFGEAAAAAGAASGGWQYNPITPVHRGHGH